MTEKYYNNITLVETLKSNHGGQSTSWDNNTICLRNIMSVDSSEVLTCARHGGLAVGLLMTLIDRSASADSNQTSDGISHDKLT